MHASSAEIDIKLSNLRKGTMAKKTALIALLAVFIFSSLSITSLAADDVEWVEKQSGVKLYWGDSVTEGDYAIKAEDFSDDMVFVSISMNGQALKTSPLSAGMELLCDDRIKVCAKNVDPNYETITKGEKEFKTENKNPFAELNISVRGEPSFDIKVEADEDTYDPCDRIDLSLTATNNGDAEARDVVLTVDTVGMELINGEAEYTDTRVPKDATLDPVNITLEAPAPWEETEYNITAKITCVDTKDKEYEYVGSKTIKVGKKWNLIISKTFPNYCHMGENAHVSVTVRNRGLCDIDDIELKDSVVSGMHLKENTELNKKLSLKSGEIAEDVFDYTLVPEMPGEFTFPQSVAVFTLPNGESKEVSSNIPGTFKVYGPNIIVTKTVDKQQLNPGDELNVTLTAQNTGNVNANVTVTDTLPSDSNFVSGETSFGQILPAGGGLKTITYTMRMEKEGEIKLPACKARFTDLDKYSGEVRSEAPVVYVGSISLEGNNTQSEGTTASSQDKNESPDENGFGGMGQGGDEGESGNVPGFGLISSLAGLLTVTCLLRSRRFRL
jgi:uncharacterized repeat protein (TIGR01451 family)